MSILFEAWRRARGDSDDIARVLGAPSRDHAGARMRALPWVLCSVLVLALAGLGAYAWWSHEPRHGGAAVGDTNSQRTSGPVARSATADEHVAARPMPPVARAHQGTPLVSSGVAASRVTAGAGQAVPGTRSPPVIERAALASSSPGAGSTMGAVEGSAPEAVREALPTLSVTVHVWNPKQRASFIAIGGKTFHDGDTIAPGVRLVRITRQGEIVRFRGYRIKLPGP